MGPYSHLFFAVKLEYHFQPEISADYYCGSVIPDIRYLAKMRRDHTHLTQEYLRHLSEKYPHLNSFLLGYQVHCLIDEIDVSKLVSAAFPLNLLRHVIRKNFSQQQMTMLVEMYYLQFAIPSRELACDHNGILADLGITPEQTRGFCEAIQEYADSRSLDMAIPIFQKIGMFESARLEKYMNIFQTMKNKNLMKAVLMSSVRNARIDQQVINHVMSRISS
jgi:hypothetical protein